MEMNWNLRASYKKETKLFSGVKINYIGIDGQEECSSYIKTVETVEGDRNLVKVGSISTLERP